MSKSTERKSVENVREFQIVENEWREQYDREWGLALVVSVDQGDGYVWVAKIEKDDEGYFVAPELAYRNKSMLRQTDKQLTNLPVEFSDAA